MNTPSPSAIEIRNHYAAENFLSWNFNEAGTTRGCDTDPEVFQSILDKLRRNNPADVIDALKTEVERLADALDGAGRYIFAGKTSSSGGAEFHHASQARALLRRLE